MSSIEDRLNAVIRSGGTSTPAPAQTAKKAAPNSISERLDKVIASGKGQPSVYKAPTSTAKASTSKNQWVSTGGGRKSTTDAGKRQGFVADPTRAKNNASSRIKNIVTGAAKSSGAGYVNTGGVLAEGAGKLNTMIANNNAAGEQMGAIQAIKDYNTMLRNGKWADGKALTADDRKKIRTYIAANQRKIDAHKNYTQAVEKSDKAVADKAYRKADQLAKSASKDISRAKQGLGKAGQFAVDVGVAGVQMGGDMALGALTGGSALPSMFVRGVGSAAQEARQSGASYGQQLGYGLGSGALSVATEKISNVAAPFKKAFGAGLADKAAGKLVSKFGESTAVQIMSSLAKRPAGKLALSMISEGGEEFLEDVVQPILQRATYDPSAKFDWSGALYDAAVGAALGGLGSGVEAVQNRRSTQQTTQQAPGAQAGVQEGTYTTSPASAADGTQNAAPSVETAPKYDALQADAIRHEGKTFRNLVAGFDTSVSEFFNKWRNGRKNTETEKLEKLYLGKMSEDAKRQASNILGYEIDSRDMIVTSDDVKHILDSHGNAEAELQRGNQPLEQWAIDAIPDVVTQPDSIVPGSTNTSGKHPGKQGVIFSKTMPNGTVVTVQFDNKGRKTMELTTMYVKKSGPTTQAFNVENTSPQLTAKPVPESVGSASSEVAPVTNADVGPAPTASVVETTPVEGTRPLNANDSIAQGAENVKNGGAADGYDNLGSARQGFTTPGMEGTERTSRIADSMPYNQYQESATGLSREDYAKLFRYESQTEGRSLHLAEELVYAIQDGKKTFLRDIDEGAFHELVQSLDDATAWNGPQMDAARMIQRELQGKSNNMEIPDDEYINFLKIMREHETSTGQGVQANAKWSRKDNNGGQASELDAWNNLERSNLSDTEKTETFRQIVKWDTDIEAVKSGDTAAMKDIILDVAEARGVLNGVTGKESKALRSIAGSSLNALTFDQLKQFAYASTSAMSTDATSANLGRKIKTIQILNMLSNPKTASKNVTGNTSFYALDALSMKGGALLDRAVSTLTGTRSMAADSVFGKGTRDAAVKAMRMSIAEITMDVDMGGANTRYGTGSQRTFKANGNFAERVISALERNQAYLLNATDEFYKGAARASEANTQRLIDEGKIKTSDKDYAKKQADQLAKYRTFQDDSKISIAIQEIHDILNMALGVGDSGKTIKGRTVHSFGAGDIAAPFTRVAGNLVSRGAEYSPLNAVKGTVEIAEAVAKAVRGSGADVELQAKGVSNAARGLTGTAIAFGFMNLVKMGLMRKADDEDDEKVAALNRAEGMTGTQLNLSATKRWLSGGGTEWQYGDTLIDLSSVEPLNLLMDLGAEMAKSEGNPVVSTFKATGKSFMSASADLPVAQFIGNVGTDVLKYNKDSMESIIKEGASTVASSLTPNVLRAAAQGLDDRPRSTSYADAFHELLLAEIKSRIPGLRETLPGSVDTLGNERMYQGTTSERLFNSMLNPVGVNHYQQGELSKELESLRERSGGNTSFYPTNRIPKEISFTDKNGKEHTAQMDYEQRQDFQRTRGTVTNGTMMAMTGTRAYKKASAERQVELMAKCQSYGDEVAKGSVLGKDSMEKWAVNAQTSKKDVGLSTVEFLNLYTDDRYKSYLVGKAYEKTKEAYRAGVSVEEYVGLKESADADGNGTISKAEASAALAGQKNRADLWDIICTTNAKNPYK